MEIINCQNLSIGYDGKKILNNINFKVLKQDYILVHGENGSGKTTLIKTLLGLIKPIKGNISYRNLKNNEIGYLPQINTSKNDFPASVYEVVISGCLNNKRLLSFYNKKDRELANMNIKKFKIEKLKNNNFMELSGGERQRVLLARAMCASSKVLILDEPNVSLDKKSSEELYVLLEKLNKEGITIIMISHDMDNSIHYANKILDIKKDEVTFKLKEDYLKEGV